VLPKVGGDDPGGVWGGVWIATAIRHAPRHGTRCLQVQEALKPSSRRRSYVFRGKREADQDSLARRPRHVALTQRLERGRFVWPQASDGAVVITSAQLGYMLEASTGESRSQLEAIGGGERDARLIRRM